jgi:hypothetical protein
MLPAALERVAKAWTVNVVEGDVITGDRSFVVY